MNLYLDDFSDICKIHKELSELEDILENICERYYEYDESIRNSKLSKIYYQNYPEIVFFKLVVKICDNEVNKIREIIVKCDFDMKYLEIMTIFMAYFHNYENIVWMIENYNMDPYMYNNAIFNLVTYYGHYWESKICVEKLKSSYRILEKYGIDNSSYNIKIFESININRYYYDYDILKFLIDMGFNPNCLDSKTKILIFINNDIEIKKLLINSGMNFDNCDFDISKIQELLDLGIGESELLAIYFTGFGPQS